MAIDGRKRDGRISIEGFLETLMCALGATPALFGDTQLYAKIAEPASAAGDRGFDVSFGDGAADADVHDSVSFLPSDRIKPKHQLHRQTGAHQPQNEQGGHADGGKRLGRGAVGRTGAGGRKSGHGGHLVRISLPARVVRSA